MRARRTTMQGSLVLWLPHLTFFSAIVMRSHDNAPRLGERQRRAATPGRRARVAASSHGRVCMVPMIPVSSCEFPCAMPHATAIFNAAPPAALWRLASCWRHKSSICAFPFFLIAIWLVLGYLQVTAGWDLDHPHGVFDNQGCRRALRSGLRGALASRAL